MMKTYGVEVAFYSDEKYYPTGKQLCLYKRYFPIQADSEKMAVATVHNILSVMEFHNFEILCVKEV